MRINKFVAAATGLSRRAADQAIANGRVHVNGQPAATGTKVTAGDTVTLGGKPLRLTGQSTTIMLNKPVGYVCSRRRQGNKTIYDLLPPEYHSLKPVGRLDKNSSGLLLLSDDGTLAHRLTHPSYAKTKVYKVKLDKVLAAKDRIHLVEGVTLQDGLSRLGLEPLDKPARHWQVSMTEGRNRQIRRTFAALGYKVTALHRTHFGDYDLGNLPSGQYQKID